MTRQFHIGVDLMIRGLDAYLDTLPAEGGRPRWPPTCGPM
jgi:hypothetical protein